jgi:ribosome-associated heat shock protein Hsp15
MAPALLSNSKNNPDFPTYRPGTISFFHSLGLMQRIGPFLFPPPPGAIPNPKRLYFCTMNKVRIDKWLWSIRIFKSRTLATDACKAGKVRVGEVPVKPSFLITIGDVVTVKKDGFNFEFKALQLIEKRVGSPIALTCYADITPAEERNKYNAWFLNGTPSNEKREKGSGRPTKKERREIDTFKESEYDWDDFE